MSVVTAANDCAEKNRAWIVRALKAIVQTLCVSRSIAATALVACATLTCGTIIGCVAPKAAPVVVPTLQEAPPLISLAPIASPIAGQTVHAVTVLCPTTGWLATLDQERTRWQTRSVYITLFKPSPLFMSAQVVTPLTVATTTPASQPLLVYVRVAEASARVNDGEPYVQAVIDEGTDGLTKP